MRKSLAALGITALAIGSIANADVKALEKAVVTAEALNIRSGPGINYSKTGILYKGNNVVVKEKSNGWVKIETSSGKTGWVSGQYLKTSSSGGKTEDTSSGKIAYVSVETSLNVRASDSTSSSVIAKLSNNTKVQVIDKKDNGWSKIKMRNGQTGWVSSAYLKDSMSNGSSNTSSGGSGNVSESEKVKVTASRLNVRKGPGTSYSVIATATQGSTAVVMENSGSWSKIKLSNGTVGWVSSQYLKSADSSDGGSSTTPSVPTSGRVKVNVSSGLNVRKGPGTSYSVITSVSGGSVVESVEKSGDWVKVKLSDGTVGWVSGQYVSPTDEPLTNGNKPSGGWENGGSIGSGESTEKGEAIVDYAYTLLGTPYQWGGNGPDKFDCSGYTQWVYRNSAGVNIPRVSRDQAQDGSPVAKGDYRKGDLLYFDTTGNGGVSHVGIYVGGDSFIHCSGTQSKPGNVKVSSLSGYYGNALLGARRFV